jgi:hypothetical protein
MGGSSSSRRVSTSCCALLRSQLVADALPFVVMGARGLLVLLVVALLSLSLPLAFGSEMALGMELAVESESELEALLEDAQQPVNAPPPIAIQQSPVTTDPSGLTPAGTTPAGGEDLSEVGLCEVCMYVLENKMQHQPYLCKGLKDPHYQNICVQVSCIDKQRPSSLHTPPSSASAAAVDSALSPCLSSASGCVGTRTRWLTISVALCFSRLACQVMESLMWWISNQVRFYTPPAAPDGHLMIVHSLTSHVARLLLSPVQVYWVNYGCQMNQNGAISWVRPCPAHAVCSWLQHLYLRKPYCAADKNFPKPA